jgi:hypothetical protein
MHRRARLLAVTVFALDLAVVGFYLWQAHRCELGFERIHAGDSRNRVVSVMGMPTAATDATIGIYGSQRGPSDRVAGCTEQYWYYPFFTPECWWIAFDAQGKVLATYHYVSP